MSLTYPNGLCQAYEYTEIGVFAWVVDGIYPTKTGKEEDMKEKATNRLNVLGTALSAALLVFACRLRNRLSFSSERPLWASPSSERPLSASPAPERPLSASPLIASRRRDCYYLRPAKHLAPTPLFACRRRECRHFRSAIAPVAPRLVETCLL